jgi:hypothetical protein
MKKMQEKAKYTTIQGKASTPPQTKAKHKLPSNQAMWMANTKFQLKRVARKAQGFSMQKTILPLKPKRITSSPSN